jgi:hypothetical protein
VYHQEQRRLAHQGDGLQVFFGVVTELAVEVLAQRERTDTADEQGIAIGGGLFEVVEDDLGTSAGLVVDNEVVAFLLGQRLRHGAGQLIGGGSGSDQRHAGLKRLHHETGFAILDTGVLEQRVHDEAREVIHVGHHDFQ